jgi:polyferredoxin
MTLQKIRRLLLIISALLFPVTIYYFSPALIINAGLEGVINGSFIVFGALLLGSVFFGRLFCSFVCPAGGLQECLFAVNRSAVKRGWKYKIKYVIWFVWIAAVAFCYIHAGVRGINFFYQTEYGISVADPQAYIIYYGIVLLIALPALIGGKRAFCHYFCWMAPFMVIGRGVRRLLRLPSITIAVVDGGNCVSCKKCGGACPMSIDVPALIGRGKIDDAECIQCGACADICPKKVLARKIERS